MLPSPKKFFLLVCSIVVFPTFVLASFGIEVPLPGLPESPTILQYAAYFFNIAVSAAGGLALLSISIGGILYLASFGNPKITNKGKEWFFAGIKGLLILLMVYIMAYTINPALLIFKLPGLQSLSFFTRGNGIEVGITENAVLYQEIPVGSLTEMLLSKTMFCYDFDIEGNPIPTKITSDNRNEVNGPTYRNHDRVDCLLKLTDAAQKKAEIISDLSGEIRKLMETCKCDGKCEDPCNKNGKGCVLAGNRCIGACTGSNGQGAQCAQPKGTESCCDAATKQIIEHGPIKIGGDKDKNEECPAQEKELKGLDEFRTQLSSVSNLIETKVQVEKKDVLIINIDGKQGVQTYKKWSDLRLIEQLMYLKEKIQEIENDIKNDISKLDAARAAVASCYNIKSSVEFLKIKEQTKKEDRVTALSVPWNDGNTNIDASKYCSGFNYSNSSCYSSCNNMCPDTTQDTIKCYNSCIKKQCDASDANCLKKQQNCISDCQNKRACLFQDPSNNKQAKTFEACVTNCRDDCSDLCAQKYLICSDDYKLCKSQCDNNSSCILDNKDACLINNKIINSDDFKNCISQENFDNAQNCIENSYLCQNGSDEFAGYPDCTTGNTGCAPNNQKLNNSQYSSPYIFDNKDKQICPQPYAVCQDGANAGQNCLNLYPAASKCPSNSLCPNCPCGEINQRITFKIDSPNTYEDNKPTIITKTISARALVTGECNEFAYDTDPLTFYCRTQFVEETTPTGENYICSQTDDIPVGQAVDDSKKWANKLLETTDSFLDSLTSLLDTAKKINDKKENEYCRCDSKYDTDATNGEKSGKPICTSNCLYAPGGIFGDQEIPPSCVLAGCSGESCQQMIDYLTQITKDYIQIRTSFIDLTTEFLKDNRTDPLKELSYARNSMNACSTRMVRLGTEKVKTVDCTIAYPNTGFLNERCYGILDGLIKNPPEDQTDDWFCCQKVQ